MEWRSRCCRPRLAFASRTRTNENTLIGLLLSPRIRRSTARLRGSIPCFSCISAACKSSCSSLICSPTFLILSSRVSSNTTNPAKPYTFNTVRIPANGQNLGRATDGPLPGAWLYESHFCDPVRSSRYGTLPFSPVLTKPSRWTNSVVH
jgi:hypothetical protein